MMKNESFIPRWGDPELDDYQWTHIPGFIMRNYHQIKSQVENDDGKLVEVIGLTPQEFTFIAHIMAFKYDVPGSVAAPSIRKIARRIGRTTRAIHNTKEALIKKGLLKIESGKDVGKPNIYNFSGLANQCREIEGGMKKTSQGGYEENFIPGMKKTSHHKNEKKEEEVKDSSGVAAADPLPDENESPPPPAKTREANPWYDAILLVFNYTKSLNGEMQKMLLGKSKSPSFKRGNIDPPMTPDELVAWSIDYRRVKLSDSDEMTMLQKPLHIQSEVAAWRAGDYNEIPEMIINAPAPGATQAANPAPHIALYGDDGNFIGYLDELESEGAAVRVEDKDRSED